MNKILWFIEKIVALVIVYAFYFAIALVLAICIGFFAQHLG